MDFGKSIEHKFFKSKKKTHNEVNFPNEEFCFNVLSTILGNYFLGSTKFIS